MTLVVVLIAFACVVKYVKIMDEGYAEFSEEVHDVSEDEGEEPSDKKLKFPRTNAVIIMAMVLAIVFLAYTFAKVSPSFGYLFIFGAIIFLFILHIFSSNVYRNRGNKHLMFALSFCLTCIVALGMDQKKFYSGSGFVWLVLCLVVPVLAVALINWAKKIGKIVFVSKNSKKKKTAKKTTKKVATTKTKKTVKKAEGKGEIIPLIITLGICALTVFICLKVF